jgi:hypothetical protein
VLLLLPPPDVDETGLRGHLGISGELIPHLLALVNESKDLAELRHTLPGEGDASQVYTALVRRYLQSHAMMSLCNALRMCLGDHNPVTERDWVRPATAMLCAAAEVAYRTAIGLHGDITVEQGLRYADIASLIQAGERFPDLAWERKWGEPVPRLPELHEP